jgi:uncharacterized membrane protein
MPPLILTALLAALVWLLLARSHWRSPDFWLIAASACGIALIAAMTRAVNVPINNQLMTWDSAAPPNNVRELWAPWDRINTIRTVLAAAALIFEALALSLSGTVGRP